MQDVVEALELARSIEGEDVEGLLHHAQPALVTTGVAADRAEGLIADVEADVAEDDLVADGHEGRGQRSRLGIGRAKQVVGQPLGGLRPDAREPGEGLDETCYRLDQGRRHASVTSPAASGHP